MKKGNKAQRAQKGREKRALRASRREARPTAPPKPKPLSPKKLKAAERAKMELEFPDAVYLPWLAQGINYLVSDFDQGRWVTLIEVGDDPPTPEELARRILTHFGEPTFGTYEELLMRTCIAWTVLPRETHYAYWREAQRRLSTQPNVDTIPNGIVWGWINEIKQYMLSAQ